MFEGSMDCCCRFFSFLYTGFPLDLKVSHDTLARRSQRCSRPESRDCSGGLAVTFLEGVQVLPSRFVRTYSGYITLGDIGVALASWWWHHSRRRRDCSHVLTVCFQVTSLKGAQGMLLWVAMSLRARCFFFPTRGASKNVAGTIMQSGNLATNQPTNQPT